MVIQYEKKNIHYLLIDLYKSLTLLIQVLNTCFSEWKKLSHDVRHSQRQAYASGTVKNLKAQWKAYYMFCIYFDRNPSEPTVEQIICYVQFLSRSFHSFQTVNNYLSGSKT